jgi:hypothetical protein
MTKCRITLYSFGDAITGNIECQSGRTQDVIFFTSRICCPWTPPREAGKAAVVEAYLKGLAGKDISKVPFAEVPRLRKDRRNRLSHHEESAVCKYGGTGIQPNAT